MILNQKAAIEDFMKRLTPEAAEIVRLDLIQTIGCALRFKRNTDQEIAALDEFVEHTVSQENNSLSWASW